MSVHQLKNAPLGEYTNTVLNWNPARESNEETFQYVDLSSVDQSEKEIIPNGRIPVRDAPSRARQIIKEGDILVSTVRPNLNGVAYVPASLDGATASTGFCVLRPKNTALEGRYLFHWVQTPQFVGDMVKKATGQSYPAVSDRIVKDSLIPLPPLDEQRRIAAILDQADALRRARRRAIERLNDLGQAIFYEMFGDPVKNPKGFEVGTIEDLAAQEKGAVRCGPFGTQLKVEELVSEGIPLLGIENVKDDNFNPKTEKHLTPSKALELKSFDVRAGDVLITRMGTIGRACVVPDGYGDARISYHLFRVRTNPGICLPEFLAETISRSGAFQSQLKQLAHGAIMAGLSTSDLKQVRFLIPPVEQQIEFVSRFKALECHLKNSVTYQVRLDTLFSSLQHRAFRGEL